MNIAILGYGRMGHEVEAVALKYGHKITAIFNKDKPLTTDSEINYVDVIISFTNQNSVLNNLKTVSQLNIPIVEGTTGWYQQLVDIKQLKNLTMIYSPNFSIGVYQFTKLTEYAAKLFGPLSDYDCYLHEWHHRNKADSPSGTAKNLAEVLLKNSCEKDYALYLPSEGVIDRNALHVTSTRVGRVPGTHEVGFDSEWDSIQLRHQAHGRNGFAIGAVQAAEWLIGKKGIFTMDDFMNSINLTN